MSESAVDSAPAPAPVEETSTVDAVEPVAEPATAATGTEDDATQQLKAVRQIEFYFADSNLPYDRFMWTLHTANDEHWVPLATVASFKRMRDHATKGLEWLASALRAKSDALELDETGTKVRRTTEVKEPKDGFERSVYAKGFGDEEPGLQAKLEEFFEQYGRTDQVRMRRDENKLFKSSVFAEFSDFASVDKFLKADPAPSWNGTPLVIMTKNDYCEMKIKEKGLTGKSAQFRRESMAGPGRKGFNAFREMAKGKDGKGKDEDKPKPEVWLDFMGSRVRVHEDEEGKGTVKPEEVPFIPGATLRVEGFGTELNFDEIKSPLKERFARVPFIEYTKGEESALVGFERALTDEELTYVKEHVKTVGGKEVTWSVPDADVEKEFQFKRASFAASRALISASGNSTRGGKGGRGARGGRGGRGGGRGTARGGGRGGKAAGGRKDATPKGEEATGEKRKRGVEPDGGPDVGVRGAGVPTIAPAKKAKVDEA